MSIQKCKACVFWKHGRCTARPGTQVDPRGKCPSWTGCLPAKPTWQQPMMIEAVALLLQGYPRMYWNQADAIVSALHSMRRESPPWREISESLINLAQFVPGRSRRRYRRLLQDVKKGSPR